MRTTAPTCSAVAADLGGGEIAGALGVWREPALSPNSSHARPRGASWKVQFFPILLFEAYLLTSLLLFAFGPIDFCVYNPTTFYFFVLFAQVVIFIGYCMGISGRPHGYTGRLPVETVLKTTIIATLVMIAVTCIYRNYGGLSLGEALADPNAAYTMRSQALQEREEVPIASVARALLGPILALFLPVGVVFWRQMRQPWRGLWLIALVGLPVETIFSGAAKSLFDLILVVPWMLWLLFNNRAARNDALHQAGRRESHSRAEKIFLAAMMAGVLLLGLNYFNRSRQARYGLSGNEYPAGTTGWSAELYGVQLPEPIEYTIYNVTGYCASGYQGLSGCLELPFEWCYGCGHSTFWIHYAERFFSNPGSIWNACYPARLEVATGYSASCSWHTIYPWLASDLTFPGAVAFMGLMAFLLARAWSDALLGENPFAIAFLSQVLLMFYYIPGNNIRLMFSEELMAFWGLLALWLFTRKRRPPRTSVAPAVLS